MRSIAALIIVLLGSLILWLWRHKWELIITLSCSFAIILALRLPDKVVSGLIVCGCLMFAAHSMRGRGK